MALAHVNGNSNTASGTSVNVALTPGGAGNLLIVAIHLLAGSTTFGISDDKGNVWEVAVPNSGDRVNRTGQLWFCKNCAAGATTVTVTSTTSGSLVIFIDEFSGHNTTSPLDVAAANWNPLATVVHSGGHTTSVANEIVYAAIFGGSVTKGASFTLGQTVSGDITEYKIVSATGVQDADATNTSTPFLIMMATFADTAITAAAPVGQLVQAVGTDPASTNQIVLPFDSAVTVGNLLLVSIAWGDVVRTISSVVDTLGNNYQIISPLVQSGVISKITYYAFSNGSGANSVTVTWNTTATNPNVILGEFSGILAADTTAGSTGSSTTPNSTAATTNFANELLVGTGYTNSGFLTPGDEYYLGLRSPGGNWLEYRFVSSTASYSAGATLTSSNTWAAQISTFQLVTAGADIITISKQYGIAIR